MADYDVTKEQELGGLLERITDGMSFNLGKVMELIWDAHCADPKVDSREIPLREAAHYLGRELDIALDSSEETVHWEKEAPSEPITEDPSFQVEGKCVGCGNYTLLNRESGLCDICVSKGVMETESP